MDDMTMADVLLTEEQRATRVAWLRGYDELVALVPQCPLDRGELCEGALYRAPWLAGERRLRMYDRRDGSWVAVMVFPLDSFGERVCEWYSAWSAGPASAEELVFEVSDSVLSSLQLDRYATGQVWTQVREGF